MNPVVETQSFSYATHNIIMDKSIGLPEFKPPSFTRNGGRLLYAVVDRKMSIVR